MNLGKEFGKTKNNMSNRALTAWAVVVTILVLSAMVSIFNLLWNYTSSVWGLPKLSYLESYASLLIINFLLHFFGFRATRRDANPYANTIEIIGKSPYEKQ